MVHLFTCYTHVAYMYMVYILYHRSSSLQKALHFHAADLASMLNVAAV